MSNGETTPAKTLNVSMGGLPGLFIQTFGQTAFGIASLLVIWWVIVKPQLELQRIDYKQNQDIVDKLREMSVTQLATSAALERTSSVLGELVREIRDAHK